MSTLENTTAKSTFHPLFAEKQTTWEGSAFRITKVVEGQVGISVRHQSDVAFIRAGSINFRRDCEYFAGGHIVSVRFGLSLKNGAKFEKNGISLNPVWGGVKNARRVIDVSQRDALVEMDIGDTLNIYYQDGFVGKASIAGGGASCLLEMCSPDEALDLRLSLIVGRFDKALQQKNVPGQDAQYHELASLLRFTAFYPEHRDKIASMVGSLTKKRGGTPLNEGVRIDFIKALSAIDDLKDYWWLAKEQQAEVVREHVKSAPAKAAVEEAPRRKFDLATAKRTNWDLHQNIDSAIAGNLSWDFLKTLMKEASEAGLLFFNTRKRFCTNAPNAYGLTDEVGKYAVAEAEKKHKPSPLRRNKKPMTAQEKKVLEARRAENRAKRDRASQSGSVKKEKKEGDEGNKK